MFASRHLSVAALCLALFSLPLSMAQTTTTVTAAVTTTATASTTATTIATTTTTATITTSGTPLPTVVPGVGSYSYQGCFNETTSNPDAGNIRALNGNSTGLDSQTVALCIATCQGLKYDWAGLEYGRECYCGPNLNSNSLMLNEDKCDIPCMGDVLEVCGGLLALSVYRRPTDSSSDAMSLSLQTNTFFRLALGSLLAFASLVML